MRNAEDAPNDVGTRQASIDRQACAAGAHRERMAPLPTDLTAERIAASPVAVPPIARHADLSINVDANRALCAHLHSGGVTSWLYVLRSMVWPFRAVCLGVDRGAI